MLPSFKLISYDSFQSCSAAFCPLNISEKFHTIWKELFKHKLSSNSGGAFNLREQAGYFEHSRASPSGN